jgi:hypothetical protein
MSSVKVEIRPYKNKELRAMYGMNENPKAWKKLLDRHKAAIGERKGQFYDVHQVKIIFQKCGVPGIFLSDELEKNNTETNKAA